MSDDEGAGALAGGCGGEGDLEEAGGGWGECSGAGVAAGGAVLLRAKSPVRVVEVRVMGDGLRLVRVKSVGAVVLLMGAGPKSCVAGVRRDR